MLAKTCEHREQSKVMQLDISTAPREAQNLVLVAVEHRFYCFIITLVDCVLNVMAYAQKPDFVFRRNGRVHLNRRGASVQSTAGSRNVRISGSNAGYTMFQGSVKSTGYPLHSPVSPSLPLPCVTVCHHISAGVCYMTESYTKSYKMKPACNGTVRDRIFFFCRQVSFRLNFGS